MNSLQEFTLQFYNFPENLYQDLRTDFFELFFKTRMFLRVFWSD